MSLSRRLADAHFRAALNRRSMVPAAIRLLERAGMNLLQTEAGVIVDGRFTFNPKLGWWRSLDGTQTGYCVATLIRAALGRGCA